MVVIYRICPKNSTKSPYFPDNKLKMVEVCLKSFIEGFGDIKPKVIFILDTCPPEYKQLIEKIVPFEKEFIEKDNLGNLGSFRKQIEIASQLDDCVLFQEDDYLYLPNIGAKLLKAVEKFDFVTPQDEYLYYFNEPRHIGKYEIKVIADHHFREVNSTTLTFACHSRLIKENKEIMYKHEIWDYPMWQELREKGYKIWCPIPTFCSHLVKDILSPCVDWKKICQKFQ